MDGDVLIAADVAGGGYEFFVTQDTMVILFEYAFHNDNVEMYQDFSLTESGGLYFIIGHGVTAEARITMVAELEEMTYNGEDGLWLTISRGTSKQVTTCKGTNCTANKCDPVIVDGVITDCQPPCDAPATCEKTVTLETTKKDWWEYLLYIAVGVLGIGISIK